jgi:hypothetical protein
MGKYLSDGTCKTTSVQATNDTANLLAKPLLSTWKINGIPYQTTSARWNEVKLSGIESHLVCSNQNLNLSHHEIPELISKCAIIDGRQYDLPYNLNFPIPQISDKNTRKDMCSARMTILKKVNKRFDKSFIFSINSTKHKLSLPKFEVKETSADSWDFNPAGVVDRVNINSYRQLLKDCVACVVGTFLWASFYQTLHNHPQSFVKDKRLLVFHYKEKSENSNNKVEKGDAIIIKPFRDFLLEHCGWLKITKENRKLINCNLELGTAVYKIKPIFYDG